MRDFKLKILTPTGEAFSGDVKSVALRTTDGEVGILAGHIDYLAGVNTCVVRICDSAEISHCAFCGGGFFSVTAGEATLVADEFVFADMLDEQAITDELAELTERISSTSDSQTGQFLKTRLIRAEAKRKALAAEQEK